MYIPGSLVRSAGSKRGNDEYDGSVTKKAKTAAGTGKPTSKGSTSKPPKTADMPINLCYLYSLLHVMFVMQDVLVLPGVPWGVDFIELGKTSEVGGDAWMQGVNAFRMKFLPQYGTDEQDADEPLRGLLDAAVPLKRQMASFTIITCDECNEVAKVDMVSSSIVLLPLPENPDMVTLEMETLLKNLENT
jgi:hypothetical protein